MLRAEIDVRLGQLHVDVDIEVADGEVVALLGPNGAGKTTVLRAIAGLQPIDAGRITLDGAALDDPAAGVLVEPHDRPIGFVFQDYLLFPRMTALDNVAFGLRSRGMAKADARAAAAGWLDRVGLVEHAHEKPKALSGGQAQRVALARALATEPRLLLLDEPLAALDAQRRVDVRSELRSHLATFSGARLLVTHDPIDAVVLADRLVIIESGTVTQTGTTAEVVARPRSRYVADLVGINLLHGTRASAHVARLDTGAELRVADPLPSADVAIAVRPQAVALHEHRPDGSPRNTWEATVAALEGDHDRVRVRLDGPIPLTAEVTPAAVAELELRPGTRTWASIKAVDLAAYPR
jgi:molybdate transport system ATP-binding protein